MALNASVEPDILREKIRRLCGLFIFFNNSRAYLIHQTAKEFLVGSSATGNASWKHCFSLVETERLMAQICIDYLVTNNLGCRANVTHPVDGVAHSMTHWPDHFRGVYRRRIRGLVIKDYKTKYALLDYAANHWISHVQGGNIIDSALITSVGKLCDIGDGSACAWFNTYSTSSFCHISKENCHPQERRTGLYWAVVLGLVVAARFFLDMNSPASYDTEDIRTVFMEASRNIKYGYRPRPGAYRAVSDRIPRPQENLSHWMRERSFCKSRLRKQ